MGSDSSSMVAGRPSLILIINRIFSADQMAITFRWQIIFIDLLDVARA
jgi:hypothetical protein